MAKYDFNNSRYAAFFESRDAANALRIFLNDPNIILERQAFWKKQFTVDPLLTTRNYDGTATYSTTVRKRQVDNMLDMRAPLGETEVRDKKGLEVYTGSIPDFAAKGFVETAMEREARIRMFESYFGNDAEILNAYADNIQDMVDEAHYTLSNMAAQVLSTGKIVYNYGTGIKGNIAKMPIPTENFVNAGTAAWADPACKLLDQMEKIEQDYRDRTESTLAMKWQVTRDTFYNVILKNKQVIDYVTWYRRVNEMPTLVDWNINKEMFDQAFATNEKISPIEIIDERQRNEGAPVRGWAQGIAVLRPVGYAGVLKRADILDKEMINKYGSSVISVAFANTDIFTFMNTTLNNGRMKEWHTDMFVAAVPVLEEFYDHIIVDITTAD